MRILYLDLDALTPSHLGCYGYLRPTSPTIDRIAAEGVRFTNVYCADAPCLPSRTGLYSGRFGIQSGVVGHGGTAAQPKTQGFPHRLFRDLFDQQGLARQFQEAGMHTAMVSPFGQRHAAHWFYAGFNEIHNTGRGGQEIVDEVQPHVERWLDAHAADDGWFLHVNYWDIHTPYRTPAGYGSPMAGEPIPDWYTDELIARHAAKGGPHSAQDLDMYRAWDPAKFPRIPEAVTDRASLTQWLDGYDDAIRYVDDAIARIVGKLKAAGVYDETAIVISADHGENHGELGIYGEHATADQGTCNIPLIIKWPGGRSGAVDDALHYQVDLAPTYMDLLGREKMPIWDGRSFAGAVRDGAASDAPHDGIVVSQCCHVCQRSARWDAPQGDHKWLYMRTYHDGFHLFPDEMLYDLARDPHEQHDLAGERPDVVAEGARRLARWHDAQMNEGRRDLPGRPGRPDAHRPGRGRPVPRAPRRARQPRRPRAVPATPARHRPRRPRRRAGREVRHLTRHHPKPNGERSDPPERTAARPGPRRAGHADRWSGSTAPGRPFVKPEAER